MQPSGRSPRRGESALLLQDVPSDGRHGWAPAASLQALKLFVCLQVLVPCCSSLGVGSFSDAHFDSYVLQPVEDGFQTLDGKVGVCSV